MGKVASIFFACIVSAALYGTVKADVIYVKPDAVGAGDGTSWVNAFTNLQSALQAADAGDQIWVAAATYRPGIAGERSASFDLRSGVALYGGFAGNETSLDQRDVVANETILSGDLAGNDDPKDSFVGNEENSYHVVTALNVGAAVVLDGFSIVGGRADGPGFGADPSSKDQGSGLNIFDSSPLIAHCTFRGNWATNHASLNDHGIATTVLECTFRDNYSAGFGAGLYIHHHSGTTAVDCTFINNVAAIDGGGAYSRSDHMAMLTGCTFIGNSATKGGGMYTDPDSMTTLMECTFEENEAEFGGGMYNDSNETMVDDCMFTGNIGIIAGAAVYNNHSGACICDCVFMGNIANHSDPKAKGNSGGAGVWNEGGIPTVTGCTFTDNFAATGAGVYNGAMASSLIEGCTFNGNTGGEGGGIYSLDSDAIIRDCEFTANRVFGTDFSVGGGITSYFSFTKISRCVFVGNEAELGGGGVYNEGDSPQVMVAFYANVAVGPDIGWGGGMLNSFDCTPIVSNCLFSGNTAKKGGGIFNTVFSNSSIGECTFSANSASGQFGEFGGGIFNSTDTVTSMTNCIVWGNSPNQIEGALLAASYSCVQGGYSGPANVADDPLFVNALGNDLTPGTLDDDLRLRLASPCINAGDQSALPPDAGDVDDDSDLLEPLPLDLDGNARVRGIALDMGAIESLTVPYLAGDMNCDDLVNTADAALFATALLDAASYASAVSYCDITRADVNGDAQRNGLDIAVFLTLLN